MGQILRVVCDFCGAEAEAKQYIEKGAPATLFNDGWFVLQKDNPGNWTPTKRVCPDCVPRVKAKEAK